MFKNNRKKRNWFIAATIANLLLVVTFFLHVPIESYVGSAGEFWFTFGAVAPMIFLVAAGAFVVLEVIALLLPATAVKLLTCIIFTISLCLYLQINFLNPDFGLLGAQFADNSDVSTTVYTNLIFWVAMLIIIPTLVMIFRKKIVRQALMGVSALLIVMQLVSVVTLVATNTDALFGQTEERVLTREGMFTNGTEDGSILVVLLDTLDSQYLENALETAPEKAEIFDGFTNYTNSTGSYTKTWGAASYIVGGVVNTNEKLVKDYWADAYEQSGLLNAMKDNGYDTRIYAAASYGGPLVDHVDNSGLYAENITDAAKLYVNFMKYVGFRTFPEIVKPYVYMDGYSFNELQREVADVSRYVIYDPAFYADLKEMGVTAVDGKTFRYYHLLGPHDPYTMDENGEASRDTNAEKQMLGCLKILEDLFAQMKEQGVYDNTTILVLGDHSRYMNGESAFMVKLPNARGAMVESSAPVSHTDVHNTLLAGAGLPLVDYGTPASEIPEDSDRIRTAWLYEPELMWIYQPEYLPPMYEVQYGHDSLAPYYTGKVYVGGKGAQTLADVAATAQLGKTYGYDALPDFFAVDSLMTGDAAQGYRHLNMRQGKLYFNLPAGTTGDVTVTLTFIPEMAVSPNQLKIACGETVLFDETYVDTMTETVSVTVPAECIENGFVALDIYTPNAEMLDDHSVISFGIKSMTVQ